MNKSNYKSRKSKSSQRNRRYSPDKDKEFAKVEDKKANNPAWYTVSPQLAKDVASLSFNNPSGIKYSLDGGSSGTFINPGLLNVYVAPVPGYSEGASSPINVAAKNIYSWVRHANSGHANYDSPDLMLYLMAMASAFSYYGWLCRIYGMVRVYSQTNRYLGANLVTACGVKASDILQNLANFRAYINQYALKLSALSVPKTMSIFERYMWMFTNIFSDENDSKAQAYMYQPAYLYQYDENNGAGRCVAKPLCLINTGDGISQNMTYGDLMAFGDQLLAALISSEDINIMSGDILKAYGKENIWGLDLIPEDFAIAPAFSEEVLSQIHNTVFAGAGPIKSSSEPTERGWDSFNITQDTSIGDGALICKPLVKLGGNTMTKHVLDFWKVEVTPEDVLVATRNMICGRRWSQGFTALEAFGTEIPMYASLWNIENSGSITYWSIFHDDDVTHVTLSDTLPRISKLSYFNEHPYLYYGTYDSTAPYFHIDASVSMGEMSNFTILDETDLEKMHLTAILSELAVPLLGNIVRK